MNLFPSQLKFNDCISAIMQYRLCVNKANSESRGLTSQMAQPGSAQACERDRLLYRWLLAVCPPAPRHWAK